MDGLFPIGGSAVTPRPSTQWGDWCLGDLSDALRRVATMLGPDSPAGRVSVYPPAGNEQLPCVQLTVDDEVDVRKIRSALSHGDYLLRFDEDPSDGSFQVEVADVHLDVSMWSGE
jgi:hypothetical protein